MNSEARFWGRMDRSMGDDHCWHWVGAIHPDGYGVMYQNGKNIPAHRFSYQLLIGPIQEGLEVDHICHNEDSACAGGPSCLHRRCVNPAHLEAVSRRMNTLRGKGVAAHNSRLTECKNGHPFDEANTRIQVRNDRVGRTRRVCRTCNLVAVRKYKGKVW